MSVIVPLDGRAYSPRPLTYVWAKQSGPGTAIFSDLTIKNPTVTLSAAGTYVLRFTATDDQTQSAYSDHTVIAVANAAPVVNAGPDLSVVAGLSVALQGSVTDDGYPVVGRNLVSTWSKVSGPGTVTFAPDSHSATASVSVSVAGAYVLQLAATDGLALATPDTMALTGIAPVRYATATPQATPTASLTDVEFMVDLSRLDNTWWASCDAAGASIRVTDSNGTTSRPFDIIMSVNTGAKTGVLLFRKDATTSNSAVRIYCGGASPVALPANDTYGQYNAYGPLTVGFWPIGRGNDRTRNLLHMTEVGAVSSTTGPIGLTSALYGSGKYCKRSFTSSLLTYISSPPQPTCTISAVTKDSSGQLAGVVRTNGGTVDSTNSSLRIASLNPNTADTMLTTSSGTAIPATCTSYSATWRQYSASWFIVVGTCNPHVVTRQSFGAAAGGANGPVSTLDYIVIGAQARLTPTVFNAGANGICLVRMRNDSALNGAGGFWQIYQEMMLDQATFWGTWTTV